jgi:hypothetical protein
MAIVYNVYSNGGSGGPVNYSTPIATTSNLSYTVGPLPPASDYRFTVRAMDTAAGIEAANTQASVRVVLDASGLEVGQRPNAPSALTARATSNGGCLASWAYQSIGQAAPPTRFLIYLTAGPTADLTTPIATVAYIPATSNYSRQLVGLADGSAYTVAVVARGASSGLASAAVTALVYGDSTPPNAVDALVAVPVP